ncbi:unnamed protein product [Pipistrellus nathusii]|uniref:Uncharacterized protein n=1 Tax=Pipistrellus nathusii TaxID=59473 RepID=A0ABN9Z6M1_PIPNA
MQHQARVNHTGPGDLQPQEAKALAQEAEEAPVVISYVHPEESETEVLPPPSASLVAAVELGLAWEAPADMTEARPPTSSG